MQALEDAWRVLLITTDAVKRLHVDKVKAALGGIGQKGLDAWSDKRGTRDSTVLVNLDQEMTIPLNPLSADSNLVLDRGCGLQVA